MTKYKMKNSCRQWDLNQQPCDLKSNALLTKLAALVECCLFELHACTPDTNVYIVISTRMNKESIFCLVNARFA